MRSVEARFRLFTKAFPSHSSLIVFGRTIRGQKFNHRTVAFYFTKLVDSEDYPKSQKRDFVRFYHRMSQDSQVIEQIQKQGVKTYYSVVSLEHDGVAV